MASYGPLVTTAASGDGATAMATYSLAIVGDATALLLYCSWLYPFWEIWKKQSVENTHAAPYVCGFLNSALWFLYGLPPVHARSTLMLSINIFGMCCMVVCLGIYLYCSHEEWRYMLCYLVAFEVIGLVVLGALVITLLHEPEDRAKVLGICAAISACSMNIQSIKDIISTVGKIVSKDAEPGQISLLMIVPLLLNALVWAVHASITRNLVVLVPNVLCVFVVVVQLIVFYKSQAA